MNEQALEPGDLGLSPKDLEMAEVGQERKNLGDELTNSLKEQVSSVRNSLGGENAQAWTTALMARASLFAHELSQKAYLQPFIGDPPDTPPEVIAAIVALLLPKMIETISAKFSQG